MLKVNIFKINGLNRENVNLETSNDFLYKPQLRMSES